jgi:hypothetical protein
LHAKKRSVLNNKYNPYDGVNTLQDIKLLPVCACQINLRPNTFNYQQKLRPEILFHSEFGERLGTRFSLGRARKW